MADLSLGQPDARAQLDQEDVTRHVLGNMVVPISEFQIERTLRGYKAAGVRMPYGGGNHIDAADIPGTIEALVEHGLAEVLNGDDFKAIADKARKGKATIEHIVEDGVDRLDGWVDAQERSGEDPSVPYYVMTKDGFEALTGHAQFAAPADEPPENVDPADVQPAVILGGNS